MILTIQMLWLWVYASIALSMLTEVPAWVNPGSRCRGWHNSHLSILRHQQGANRAAIINDNYREAENLSCGRKPGFTTTLASGGHGEDTTAVEGTQDGDEEPPIFYIKGLKDGGGVGAWGDTGTPGIDEAEAGKAALRNSLLGQEGEGEEAAAEGTEGESEGFDWGRLQQSLGLGTWSFVGLGTALFIITLNNALGLGWLGRFLGGSFDTEGIVDVEGKQQRQVQVMQLDDDANLLR